MGYSAAFSTQPGFSEKSMRGGQKMSTSWLVPFPTASVVWMEGGGMTAMDGVPHSSCWSSRHIALSMPHGQRK